MFDGFRVLVEVVLVGFFWCGLGGFGFPVFSCFMWGWYNMPFRLYFWIFGLGLFGLTCGGFGDFRIFWSVGCVPVCVVFA